MWYILAERRGAGVPGLTRNRHLEVGEDCADVALEAHVNHAVSLIQGQVATDV
jgi:hypothetical protein